MTVILAAAVRPSSCAQARFGAWATRGLLMPSRVGNTEGRVGWWEEWGWEGQAKELALEAACEVLWAIQRGYAGGGRRSRSSTGRPHLGVSAPKGWVQQEGRMIVPGERTASEERAKRQSKVFLGTSQWILEMGGKFVTLLFTKLYMKFSISSITNYNPQ